MQTPLPFAPVDPAPSIKLHHEDCLAVMPTLKAQSLALFFADLPYGVSHCDWDTPIDLVRMWDSVNTICVPNGSQVFTATQPFATSLINSHKNDFRYDLIWQRSRPTGFYNAKRAPMRDHEHVLVFGRGGHAYNPQMSPGKRYNVTSKSGSSNYYAASLNRNPSAHNGEMRFPRSVLRFEEHDLRRDSLNGHIGRILHPTQKPVALLEWLIKTYTNPGDTVLDPVFGSCTTGVACLRTGRNFIGIEKDAGYFEIGRKRIADEQAKLGYAITV